MAVATNSNICKACFKKIAKGSSYIIVVETGEKFHVKCYKESESKKGEKIQQITERSRVPQKILLGLSKFSDTMKGRKALKGSKHPLTDLFAAAEAGGYIPKGSGKRYGASALIFLQALFLTKGKTPKAKIKKPIEKVGLTLLGTMGKTSAGKRLIGITGPKSNYTKRANNNNKNGSAKICGGCGHKISSNSRHLVDLDTGTPYHQNHFKEKFGSIPKGLKDLSEAEAARKIGTKAKKGRTRKKTGSRKKRRSNKKKLPRRVQQTVDWLPKYHEKSFGKPVTVTDIELKTKGKIKFWTVTLSDGGQWNVFPDGSPRLRSRPAQRNPDYDDTFINKVTNGYLTTMLWSSNDDKGEPLEANYGLEDIDSDSVDEAKTEIRLFMEKAGNLFTLEELKEPEDIGHNFWLTRNGHGTGFWESGRYAKGDELTKIAKQFGEAHPFPLAGEILIESTFKANPTHRDLEEGIREEYEGAGKYRAWQEEFQRHGQASDAELMELFKRDELGHADGLKAILGTMKNPIPFALLVPLAEYISTPEGQKQMRETKLGTPPEMVILGAEKAGFLKKGSAKKYRDVSLKLLERIAKTVLMKGKEKGKIPQQPQVKQITGNPFRKLWSIYNSHVQPGYSKMGHGKDPQEMDFYVSDAHGDTKEEAIESAKHSMSLLDPARLPTLEGGSWWARPRGAYPILSNPEEEDLAPGEGRILNKRRKLGIHHDPTGYYTAMTATRSKDFKTYGGALRWLNRVDPEGMAEGEPSKYEAYDGYDNKLRIGDRIKSTQELYYPMGPGGIQWGEVLTIEKIVGDDEVIFKEIPDVQGPWDSQYFRKFNGESNPRKLAILSSDQNAVWENAMVQYLNEGYSDQDADAQAWNDLLAEYPELVSYEGIDHTATMQGQQANPPRSRKPRWKRGSRTQSIAFEKDRWTVGDAKKWLRKEGKKAPKVDRWKNYLRFRQEPPEHFVKKHYATIPLGEDTGIWAIIAEPKAKYYKANPKGIKRRSSTTKKAWAKRTREAKKRFVQTIIIETYDGLLNDVKNLPKGWGYNFYNLDDEGAYPPSVKSGKVDRYKYRPRKSKDKISIVMLEGSMEVYHLPEGYYYRVEEMTEDEKSEQESYDASYVGENPKGIDELTDEIMKRVRNLIFYYHTYENEDYEVYIIKMVEYQNEARGFLIAFNKEEKTDFKRRYPHIYDLILSNEYPDIDDEDIMNASRELHWAYGGTPNPRLPPVFVPSNKTLQKALMEQQGKELYQYKLTAHKHGIDHMLLEYDGSEYQVYWEDDFKGTGMYEYMEEYFDNVRANPITPEAKAHLRRFAQEVEKGKATNPSKFKPKKGDYIIYDHPEWSEHNYSILRTGVEWIPDLKVGGHLTFTDMYGVMDAIKEHKKKDNNKGKIFLNISADKYCLVSDNPEEHMWNKEKVQRKDGTVTVGENEIETVTYTLPHGELEIWKDSPFADGRTVIYSFRVDEEERGKGIGSTLLQVATDELGEISGQVSNIGSVIFHYKNGFRPTDKPDATLEESIQMFKGSGADSLNMTYTGIRKPNPIYAITSGGLKPLQTDIKLYEKRTYYLGASSDPDMIYITDIDDNLITYRKYPYHKDLRIETNIGKDLIIKGTNTRIKNLQQWKKAEIGEQVPWIDNQIKELQKKLQGEKTKKEDLDDYYKVDWKIVADKTKFKDTEEFYSYVGTKYASVSGYGPFEATGFADKNTVKKMKKDKKFRYVIEEEWKENPAAEWMLYGTPYGIAKGQRIAAEKIAGKKIPWMRKQEEFAKKAVEAVGKEIPVLKEAFEKKQIKKRANIRADIKGKKGGGSGWGKLKKGLPVDWDYLRQGQYLLYHSKQFKAKNVFLITDLRNYGAYGHFVKPSKPSEKRLPDDRTIFFYDTELISGEFWWPKGKFITKNPTINEPPFSGTWKQIKQFILDNYDKYTYIHFISPKTDKESVIIPHKYGRSWIRKAKATDLHRVSVSNPEKSNLIIKGFGRDRNGNKIIKLGFPNQRGFSIQTLQNVPSAHRLSGRIKDLTEEEQNKIESEAIDYISKYGSQLQKDSLKIYGRSNNPVKGQTITFHVPIKDIDKLLDEMDKEPTEANRERALRILKGTAEIDIDYNTGNPEDVLVAIWDDKEKIKARPYTKRGTLPFTSVVTEMDMTSLLEGLEKKDTKRNRRYGMQLLEDSAWSMIDADLQDPDIIKYRW